jgi:hypothetical protein
MATVLFLAVQDFSLSFPQHLDRPYTQPVFLSNGYKGMKLHLVPRFSIVVMPPLPIYSHGIKNRDNFAI